MKIPFSRTLRTKLTAWPRRLFYIAFVGGFLGALLFALVAGLLFFGGRSLWNASRNAPASTVNFLNTGNDIVDVVGKANPAVVSIIISRDVPTVGRGGSLFGFIPEQSQSGGERQIGGGSGFIVSPDGLVVTNKHVVSLTDANYTIYTADGKKHNMEIVDTDPFFDLAVVKIKDGRNYPYLKFGDSENLALGETAIAIGNALGEFRNSVSVGVVSGLSRSIQASDGQGGSELLDEVIQTDAAINPGNSGGPLLDANGEVIGVNVAVASDVENIGFALPAEIAEEAVTSVQKGGHISRPYLGVRFVKIDEQVRQDEGLSVNYGALILSDAGTPAIVPGSPAAAAGLRSRDIIIAIDGESLSEKSLSSIIRTKKVGQRIEITYLRDGRRQTTSAVLKEVPPQV